MQLKIKAVVKSYHAKLNYATLLHAFMHYLFLRNHNLEATNPNPIPEDQQTRRPENPSNLYTF